jgi:Domain of unknown function (DU1801)
VTNSDNKTKATDGDVQAFLSTVADEQRRRDAGLLIDLMGGITGQPAVLWGTSIIGFGSRHYRYESGREGDMPSVSFSPRKAQTVLYLGGGVEKYADLLPRLGAHRTGKGCLYLKRVGAADTDVLREIIARSYEAAETTSADQFE